MSGVGALLFGGRWNPPEVVSTIYVAFPEDACVAEFLKTAGTQAGGARAFAPRLIHTLEASELEVVDISRSERLAAVGLTYEDIESHDWSACQSVGETANFLGRQGVLAPSSTGIGSVIAIFEPRIRPGQLRLVESRPLASVFGD